MSALNTNATFGANEKNDSGTNSSPRNEWLHRCKWLRDDAAGLNVVKVGSQSSAVNHGGSAPFISSTN